MTRANSEQIKHTPWFAKAGAACSIVPISRFVGPNVFALKGGGYGCLFSLTGIDEEGLTDQELDSRMRSIEGALRGLPEGSCLYQYARVRSGFELPRQPKYVNSVTQVFVEDRLTFLEKTATFRRIDLHWCLTLEPSKAKAFEREPQENTADTSRMLAELQKTATILESHLGGALGLRLLPKNDVFQFFSYLFNLEDWASDDQLRSDTGVDRQIVKNPVAWHSDYLQIGKRHVQMFSLKTTPEASRPCQFSGLLTLDCDSVLCSTWSVKSTSSARSEIDAQEKFISFFKVGVLTRVMSGRDTASLETGAGAKAANSNVDDLSQVIRELDKKAQGEYSLRLLLAARSAEQLREAHRDAVNVALNELERYTQARIGGNSPAETTGKFAAAKFEHDTARPVDGYAAPQLHTHVVVFNMTERDNGSMRALQPHALFESQQFATAVYQSHLTYKLRDLGYEIEAGKSGAPDVKGYTVAYLEASSPRRQQIEEALGRSGFSGPEAAQIAAHNTRDKKIILSPDQILAAHKQIADEFGNQADQVVVEARSRRQAQGQERPAKGRQQQVREAVTFARDKGFEREAVVDERALYVDALRRGMGEMTYPEVRASFESRIASGEFKQIADDGSRPGRRFTTAAIIKAETEIVQKVQDGQSRAPQIMSIESAVPLSESRPHFNAAQKRVVEEVLTSRDQVQGLQGRAGSGKTSVLATIREGAELNGYAVEGFAPTSRAAKQLRDAGIKADTLQRFLAGGGLQAAGDPANRHLYMVDESSLASTQQMRDFLQKIGPHDKALLIGDIRQHQGVDAGKPFEQLQEAGMKTAQLDQIMRQKDPELLKAVEHLSNNETAIGVEMLAQQGRITEIVDPQRRVSAIAKEYAAHPENTLIVSPDNASRRAINQAVREELQALGVVDKADHSMRVLAPRNDMTGADREWASRYETGDVLHYTRGSKEHGIEPRSYAQVVTTNPSENLITVRKDDGQQVTYDPSRLRGIAAYREIERQFAIGEKIQFTAPNRDLQVANRDLGTIQSIGEDGRISVRMDGTKDRIVRFDANEMRHLDHGYAVTSHSSQGLTSERVLVNMDTEVHPELISSRFAYVSVSRASHDARIFTNNAASLAGSLSQDVSKASAVSFGKGDNPARNVGLGQTQAPAVASALGLGLTL